MYWIDYYGTFHNGYNLTIGGDGKSYINEKEIIKLYKKYKNQTKVQKILNIDTGTVRKYLRKNNIDILSSSSIIKNKNKKKVFMMSKKDEKIIKVFSTFSEGKRYIENNMQNKYNIKNISESHIQDQQKGKRLSQYGFKWKVEYFEKDKK